MKSYKIKEDFYLNEKLVEVPKEEKKELKVEPKHQYIIIDRSGSMWDDIDLVVDTIIKYVDKLPEGLTVSLGYFSGYSEYGLSVPYELKKEKDGVVKTANSYRETMGCTNFTEILEKIKSDCKGRNSSLFFFTDGCHNCGPFSNVQHVLEELRQYLEVTVFVGCGYINRDNMLEMARITEGSFIQLSSFTDFEQTLNDFGESVGDLQPSVLVEMNENDKNICSILGKNIIQYTVEDNKINFKPSEKNKQVVYYTSKTPDFKVEEISNRDEVCARTLVYTLVQNNRVPEALMILNTLGDKCMIRKLYNTFTQDEYGVIENELLKSIFDSRKRYREGKVKNFLPEDDAFCVLDALDILANSEKVKIHLNDPDFKYKSISRKTIQEDGSKLEYTKDIQASANNLKYHESRLNVNLNVFYEAKVPLKPEEFKRTNAINESLEDYGFNNKSKYPVVCIRNYNIIQDGKLNTEKLVLSGLDKDTKNKLSEYLTLRLDGKYILDLSGLTLINKSYLKSSSAEKLAKACWEAQLLSTEISVLKYLKNLQTSSEEECNADLVDFLANNYYIKNNMYQPPKTSVEATDEYPSYEFNVSFKGYSKASASSVIKKIKTDKKLTERESIVGHYYELNKDLNLQQLESRLKSRNAEYKKLQSNIQHCKFAIVLINRGCMDEFSNRDDMSLDIDVSNYHNGIDNVHAEFKIVQKAVKI